MIFKLNIIWKTVITNIICQSDILMLKSIYKYLTYLLPKVLAHKADWQNNAYTGYFHNVMLNLPALIVIYFALSYCVSYFKLHMQLMFWSISALFKI